MNQRKPNRKTWYSLGLTVLLCIALLAIATGATLARYRAEREKEVDYRVRVPEQIHLGTVSVVVEETEPEGEADATETTGETEAPVTTEVFTPSSYLVWETKAGVTQLTFAVANGASASDYSARDQRVRLRMIGTLGIWTGSQTPTLHLILPPEEDSDQERIITATVTPFTKGSALHLAYGDGWMYTFLDEEGEELYWDLPGGKLAYVTHTIVIEGEVPENLNLLQPQVIAEVIAD